MNERRAAVRLEVSVNGVVRGVGGIAEYGVLHAIIGWLKRRLDRIHPDIRADPSFDETKWLAPQIDIQFGGLDSSTDRHVTWLHEQLKVGDVVTVRVLGEGEYDQPTEGSPERKLAPNRTAHADARRSAAILTIRRARAGGCGR